jgi:hypothetical protein
MMILLVVCFVIIGLGYLIDTMINKAKLRCAVKYIRARAFYYKHRLKKNPGNITLEDKYLRAKYHFFLLSIEHYISYLTEHYGSFEICPFCNFPKIPERLNCSHCNKIENQTFENFMKVVNAYHAEDK